MTRMVFFYVILVFIAGSCSPKKSYTPAPEVSIKADTISFIGPKVMEIREGKGLMMNISADGIVEAPSWGSESALSSMSAAQAVSILNTYLDSFAGTQVSTLLFNVNFQRSCYDSRVMESYWDVRNPETDITGWPRKHWQLSRKGLDIYALSIARCRVNRISPWLSIRMNDHHYFDDSSKINRFWWQHPEHRLNTSSLFNYVKSEVRAYYRSYITEALDRYDVDGIELDMMRHYILFRKGEEGLGGNFLDEFMKEIRELVRSRELARGHPIRIAVRVPSTPALSRAYGLNAVGWVQRGQVDILIPSNWYHPTNFDIPVEEWRREIGGGSVYTLAPGADVGYVLADNKYVKRMSSNIESMRGFSVSAYSRGADAVYFFNNFNSAYRRKVVNADGSSYQTDDRPLILGETGQYSTSINKPRSHVYTYSEPDVKPLPAAGYTLQKDAAREFNIHSGPRPISGSYTVRIGLESLSGFEGAELRVKVNEVPCTQVGDMPRDRSYVYTNTKQYDFVGNVSETGARVMQFRAAAESVRDGYNRITVVNAKNEPQTIIWLEVFIQ